MQAAPRLVSDLSAEPVAFADAGTTTTPLALAGRGVDSGGWTSLVAPFELVASSPQLDGTPGTGTSDSSVGAGDLRYVGFASTAPQLAAAGADPAVSGHGTLGIAIATEGQWASLGNNVIPIIDTDIDGDGIWDLETYVRKYSPDLDFTTVETYALDYTPADGYSVGDLLDLAPVNGLWASFDTTVFDSDVVVAPMNLDAVGIAPGSTPTFLVATYSPYAPSATGIVDEAEPFTADPYAPAYWFDGGPGSEDSLWYLGATGTPFTVQRAATTGDGQLLLLHTHNADGARAQVVDVTAPVATATTTTLAVDGALTEGSEQELTATVAPAEATGTVRFLDGTTELGTAPVTAGNASLTVILAVGAHALQAVFEPGVPAWSASSSEVVPVEITARYTSRISAQVPRTAQYGARVDVPVTVRSQGASPTGRVEVSEGGTVLASARLLVHGRTGAAIVRLPRDLAVGQHHLTITYTGNEQVAPSSVDRDLRIVRGHGRS